MPLPLLLFCVVAIWSYTATATATTVDVGMLMRRQIVAAERLLRKFQAQLEEAERRTADVQQPFKAKQRGEGGGL